MNQYPYYFDDGTVLMVEDDLDDDFRNAPPPTGPRVTRADRRRRVKARRPAHMAVMRPLAQPVAQPQSEQDKSFKLRDLSVGTLVELATQVLAVMQPLPEKPRPADSPADDIVNLIDYQESLAAHAKADERIRTLGSVVSRIVD